MTGGAGFIGSNIVKSLNQRGITDILVVDDLTNGKKFKNLVDCEITDYIDQEDFLEELVCGECLGDIEAVFHEGACSTTTEWNGKFMMENNYEYSKILLDYCLEGQVPFLYASSAAVYGDGKIFKEERAHEKPLNVYGYSKFLFDQHVRKILPTAKSQIVGCRYFNVYGPRESHKGSMASVAFHQYNQIREHGVVKLFEGCDGYGNGEQSRDFIHVDDVVKVNLWFLDNRKISGIFNVGTGRAQPFNDIANTVIECYGKGRLEYIPFPDHLKGSYQSFTEADISQLRAAGYKENFKTVQEGVAHYFEWLNKQKG